MKLLLLFCLSMVVPALAMAEEAKPSAQNPSVEVRVKQLAGELRCLVCQNQTLADSNAPLAEDLRQEIREMASKNMSDRDILDFLVARYGDFVLYRPPVKATTLLLWGGPFILLVVGLGALLWALRSRARKISEAPLSTEERQRVTNMLMEKERLSS
ncbi:MAG: cytochrome c-type biogenesis protein CcmH [Nitrospiraceae bacterium]|nr:cytochrome c-type biogenesis protein CcmH [Nitrospiraceae bacterium]